MKGVDLVPWRRLSSSVFTPVLGMALEDQCCPVVDPAKTRDASNKKDLVQPQQAVKQLMNHYDALENKIRDNH